MNHRLLDTLPAIYQRSEELKDFLSVFDAMLFGSGSDPGRHKGLAAVCDEIPSLFDPKEAPAEFLIWLAQWAGLSLSEGTPESLSRRLIKEMIPLYQIRGTRAYVKEVLELYTSARVSVEELERPGMEVGVRSTVGVDARLGEDPFYFRVTIRFSSIPSKPAERRQLVALANAIVASAKPAYTHYDLLHNLEDERRGFVISVRSTVGIDSLL